MDDNTEQSKGYTTLIGLVIIILSVITIVGIVSAVLKLLSSS